jgi:putative glutamine amidotransferase
LGGTLNQEVTKAGTVHEPITKDSDPDTLNRQRHPVHFESGSLLAGAFGTTEIKTNSLHHQGIDQLSPDLVVEARTDDGLIEAARCRGDWWALGVQWHPERMDPEHQQPLFSAFRAAITG